MTENPENKWKREMEERDAAWLTSIAELSAATQGKTIKQWTGKPDIASAITIEFTDGSSMTICGDTHEFTIKYVEPSR